MQPHHYALAAGILWLVTLPVMSFIIATVQKRAYELGFDAGKLSLKRTLKIQLQEAQQTQEELRTELEQTRQDCTQQLAARLANIDALKSHITDLEARIMSYTGMAVTRADHDRLISTAETLRLAARTMELFKAQPHSAVANTQAGEVEELAKRIHAHIRATPAAATTTEAAA
jgi:hypothetical protein